MENPQTRIINLKHQLYGTIIEKPQEFWTETEIELAHILSQDKDIQRTLSNIKLYMKKIGKIK